MAPTKRKAKPAQSDFKRLKAKVGKRALKPVNETDTSFRAASLHVSGQTVSSTGISTSLLLSSRGKSLPELVSQLGHPSGRVRISSIKGIGNLVAQHKLPSRRNGPSSSPHQAWVLQPHLSTLLRACARACVDEEEPDAREEGLKVLEDLLLGQKNAQQHSHLGDSCRPFWPLLLAYATSSMHGLDSQLRVDGARFIHLLCRCPSFATVLRQRRMGTGKRYLSSHLMQLLDQLCRILSDHNVRSSVDTVLKTVVSLLKASVEQKIHLRFNDGGNQESDLEISATRQNSAALILAEPRNQTPIGSTLSHESSIRSLLEHVHAVTDQSGKQCSEGMSRRTDYTGLMSLLSVLRDILVETTEQDGEEAGTQRLQHRDNKSNAWNLEMLQRLILSIKLLWKLSLQVKVDGIMHAALLKRNQQVVSILNDIFPLSFEETKCSDHTILETTNAMIASAILDLQVADSDTGASEASTDWISSLTTYCIHRLQQCDQSHTSSPSLDVFCSIVRAVAADSQFKQHRAELFGNIEALFFESNDATTIRSQSTRKVTVVVVRIVQENVDNMIHSIRSSDSVLGRIFLALQRYLVTWAADFIYESGALLDMLFELSRRSPLSENDSMLQTIRSQVAALLVSSPTAIAGPKRTIFEEYPEHLQRRCLAIQNACGYPSRETLTGMASISSRSSRKIGVSSALCDEILELVHSHRKSIPMADFFAFLVNSLGMPKAIEQGEASVPPVSLERIYFLDDGIRRIAKSCIRCGSMKVAKALAPQLLSWLKTSKVMQHQDVILRSRVVTSLLAILGADYKSVENDESVSFLLGLPTVSTAWHKSSAAAIVSISSNEKLKTDWSKLLSPYMCLLAHERELYADFVHSIKSSITTMGSSEQSKVEEVLNFMEIGLARRGFSVLS